MVRQLLGPGDPGRSLLQKGVARLSELNPYSSPKSQGKQPPLVASSRLRIVRTLFYLHLAVVCFWAAFTLSDTGLISVPRPLEALFYVRIVQLPLAFTWMLFPAMMAYAAAKLTDRSRAFRTSIVLSDVMLSIFQLWVMLPLVQ